MLANELIVFFPRNVSASPTSIPIHTTSVPKSFFHRWNHLPLTSRNHHSYDLKPFNESSSYLRGWVGTLESCPDSTPTSSTTSIPSTPPQIVLSPTKSSYEQESSFIRFQTIQCEEDTHPLLIVEWSSYLHRYGWQDLNRFVLTSPGSLMEFTHPFCQPCRQSDCRLRHKDTKTRRLKYHDIVSIRNPSKKTIN